MTLTEHYSDYKWLKVKRYQADESLSFAEQYEKLHKHHIEETTFLIEEVRKLARQVDNLKHHEE